MLSAMQIFLILVVLPAVLSLVVLVLPKKAFVGAAAITIGVLAIDLVVAIMNFGRELVFTVPWLSFGMDFSLRFDMFSTFAILAAVGFGLIVAIYSASYLRGKAYAGRFFFFYLLTIAFASGALMANNMVLMLFFWEGLLVTLFGMLLSGGRHSIKTAVKALTLNGIADLCLILGVGLTAWLAGTLAMDQVNALPVEGIAILGFMMMMFGAIGKSGSMPFHSWIPDAADDAPLPFMALLPGALEKVLGIYLLVRVSVELYQLMPGSAMSTFMLVIGCCTLIFAVMMALAQKNFTKMLSYHAISQVGYMVIGIGSALPIGIVGAVFHMINHALYKSTLFMSGGALRKQAGTDDIDKLGGLAKMMPITTVLFVITAVAACGIPPLNGFFSKELLMDSAFETGKIVYIICLVGAFLTSWLFMKIGHATFFGKSRDEKLKQVKECAPLMWIPMIIPAAFCILFGVWNSLPLNGVIGSALSTSVTQGADYSGWPESGLLVLLSIAAVVLGIVCHLVGAKKAGSAAGSFDIVRNAPVLRQIYNAALKRYLDPYTILMVIVKIVSYMCYGIDRAINWIYDVLLLKAYNAVSIGLFEMNDGNQANYIKWALGGMVLIIFIVLVLI